MSHWTLDEGTGEVAKDRISGNHGVFEKGEEAKNAGWLVLCGGVQKDKSEWRISTTDEDWQGGFITPNTPPRMLPSRRSGNAETALRVA